MDLSLGKIKRIQAVHIIFGGDERLLQFFFHQNGPHLRYTPAETLSFGKEFSLNDFIMIQIALELMGTKNSFLLKSIFDLDDEYFINALNGFLYLKEISMQLSDIC